jgi:hypothetical protein
MEMQTRNKICLVKELKHIMATGCWLAQSVCVEFVANSVTLRQAFL